MFHCKYRHFSKNDTEKRMKSEKNDTEKRVVFSKNDTEEILRKLNFNVMY